MPTKTERILSYLPRTFRSDEREPVLHTLVDTFGVELLAAENSLAAVMAAHWVDHADRGAREIDDLQRMSSLYGLLPREDESVEKFREHLKRYVRTFLEGTVTVQGLLRVSAEALNLHIADLYEVPGVSNQLDTWWTRHSHFQSVFEPRFDDAASILVGFGAATSVGDAGNSARVIGRIDVAKKLDTRQRRFLKLTVDGVSQTVDLQEKAASADRVSHAEIEQAINEKFGAPIASIIAQTINGVPFNLLQIESPKTGIDSRVSVVPLPPQRKSFDGRFVTRAMITDEATQFVLGYIKRAAFGTAATRFTLASDPTIDLTRGIDLQDQSILKLSVDGQTAVEIDCAGSRPRATLRKEVIAAINAEFPDLAVEEEELDADEKGVKLTSPTSGPLGSIKFEDVESDARLELFGDQPAVTLGEPSTPATLVGKTKLPGAVDLSQRSKMRISVNGDVPVDIDVAGADPASTFLDEIVDAVNAVYPGMASSTDDDELKLTVPTSDDDVATSLAVLPLRCIDLIEYPPVKATELAQTENGTEPEIRHGDKWSISNPGACDAIATILITAVQGAYGPTIINRSQGYMVRIMRVFGNGDQAKLFMDDKGELQVTLITEEGETTYISSATFKKLQELHDDKAGVNKYGESVVTFPSGETTTTKFADRENVVGSEKLDNNQTSFNSIDPLPNARVLTLSHGTSEWGYLDCHASRFDFARFAAKDDSEGARFAGGTCLDRGTFNASPFENVAETVPPPDMKTVFGSSDPSGEPGVTIQFEWESRNPGAVTVNLPTDLPERFGGRFNEARFGSGGSSSDNTSDATESNGQAVPNQYKEAVTEPDDDPKALLSLVTNDDSSLVMAESVPIVPLGFEVATLPLREPTFLSGGTDTQRARVYLAEDGRAEFILLQAREPGKWGNQIYLTAHLAGPAMFDVVIRFDGSRFENARHVVLGDPAQSSSKTKVQPGRVGVLQAKAAGIHIDVTRNHVLRE